jgi:peptidoglycan/xylan/chitin deacetylase (PgdA/CDA1 family)
MKAILTYHSIDDSRSPVSVSPAVFQEHARFLSSGRVRALSLDELLADSVDADAVAVTFDDGFRNTRDSVIALTGAGVPVTVFAVSDHVGGTNAWGGRDQIGIPTLPLLGWPELADLIGRGVRVEAHTRTHPRLTTVSAEALEHELIGCRTDLRARLGVECRHVAYPYGDLDDRVAASAAAHYRYGHTTEFRPLRAQEDAARIPRLDMYYFHRPGAIDHWGRRGFQARLSWIRARRSLRASLLPR